MFSKKIYWAFFLLPLFFSCSSWGYRGPISEWTEDDIIYFDVVQKRIVFADSSKAINFVSVSWGKSQYFEQKDMQSKSNSYTLPVSISNKIANQRFNIKVFPQHMTCYTIDSKAKYWNNKKYVYGYPLNDVSNSRQMQYTIAKLNKDNN